MTAAASDAIAVAVRAMLGSDLDVQDTLGELLRSSKEALGVRAVAVFVVEGSTGLAMLVCSSHDPEVVRLLQEVAERGPARDEPSTERLVCDDAEGGAASSTLDVVPMRWHGGLVGATVVLRSTGTAPDPELTAALAETATLVVAQLTVGDHQELRGALHHALLARDTVEQAKGLVSYVRSISLVAAYEQLEVRARATGRTVTGIAGDIVAGRGQLLP